jgi:capsular exopolysaccharide synthesis family protein
LSGENPAELTVLVNAITQAYLQEVVTLERDKRSARKQELEKLLTKFDDALRNSRNRLRKLAEEVGTPDSQAIPQRQILMLQTYGEARRELTRLRHERLRAQEQLAILLAQEKLLDQVTVTEAEVNQALDADPIAQQLLVSMARDQQIVREYQQFAVNPNETTLVRARARLSGLQKDLETRRAEVRAGLVGKAREKARQHYEIDRQKLETEANLLAKQEKEATSDVDRLTKEVEKIGTSTTEMEMLRTRINDDDATLKTIGKELNALSVELNSPPRVSLYQEAALQRREMKRQILGALLGAAGAFGLVAFAIGWWEFRARRVQTTDEVVLGLGMRVVGAMPSLPTTDYLFLDHPEDQQDVEGLNVLESIDGIRTILLRDASVEAIRVVMVTSAVGGEGKTTLASHLASSLARAGRRTLFIDCDLRRPSAHQLFELEPHPGFSEALLGEVPVADATRLTPVSSLWMMPAGQWDRELTKALATDRIEQLFHHLRQEYDFVIVDSHPVLTATDALLIGQHVDAVLLSLLRDVSQLPRVYAACQRLTNLGIRVLGAVVNGVPPTETYGNHSPSRARNAA